MRSWRGTSVRSENTRSSAGGILTGLASVTPDKASSPLNLRTEDSRLSLPRGSESKRRRRKPPASVAALADNKLLISREQAAAMLSISVRGVDYFVATKQLSTRRIGASVLIPIEDVRKLARADHPERMAGTAKKTA